MNDIIKRLDNLEDDAKLIGKDLKANTSAVNKLSENVAILNVELKNFFRNKK